MKIDNASHKSIGSLPNARAHPAKGPAGPAAPAAATVDISSAAGRMHEIESMLANVPLADPARVAEIRQAIAEGRFRVDAEKVADGLIESVRQMLAAQSGAA
ncbi:MAG: flagellar biosynthesis anti-sigma factor FlgM [Rhodocyclales bacterium CG17_big_fil_post_rev_8_21_14_2_50_68_7]|nr:MAG: flagellar biosynthesis anti-sigma factor FlgM [Betaproteobacteria bacterium CG2_30_68_42]PIV76899.1 MAG: flagellar biosynthesis anti-sigma factor FlgM [Rhodocyclales bacterium CG17_big_fil_post_rev_8_21_14_2_50_68_7]PJA56983.1 MAG: flagellar biosynthesis anti-sigma factor FlgM [Rhodocyclales bacterium CG_4_9_14_3_um_filter_68_10]